MENRSGINDKNWCLRKYSHLVNRLAYRMMVRLPSSVQIDDIIQDGMIGLLDAASRYDEFNGAQFETYATQRICGAILDELRGADWLPRGLRRDMRRIEAAIHRLQQELGRSPSEIEIANEMNLPLAEYQQLLHESRGAQLVYYEDLHGEEHGDFFERFEFENYSDPLDALENACFMNDLVRAFNRLPERERMVMGMIYEQEMNLPEASAIMGVSESRVSQLHSQAIARLRCWMRSYSKNISSTRR